MTRFASLAIACVLAVPVASQSKPDFSGKWHLNTVKSKLPVPMYILATLSQKGNELTESLDFVEDAAPDANVKARYVIGGTETEVQFEKGSAKASAKWEGNTLLLEWKSEMGTTERRLSLSLDGKTLTMTYRNRRADGSVEESLWVLDRVSG